MNRLIRQFSQNRVLADLLLVMLLLLGAAAAVSMTREVFPDFSMDTIVISVEYPGADPEEVEEGVSRKIEEALDGMPGIRQYVTQSAENRASAEVEIKSGYETDDVLNRIRTKISAISTFPKGAEKPVIAEVIHRSEVMRLYLCADMPEHRLREWAVNFRDDLKRLPEVSQVEIGGLRDYEIAIEISEARMRQYGLTFADVAEAVSESSVSMGGGVIRTGSEDIRVRTTGRRYTGREFAGITLLAGAGGERVPLDRVADIRDGFGEDPLFAAVNGKRAALVSLFKTGEEDALAIARAVREFTDAQNRDLPEGAEIGILYDTTDDLKARIDMLVKNGLMGLCLVFLLLWLFLDLRLGFWVGMGIPISLSGALALLWAMGESVNMISLFGLILVLGIVVDDAVVVGEAVFARMKSGSSPAQAVAEGIREVGRPVTVAVVTTVIAFIPLMCIGGLIGKFIAILPVTVIACLVISLVECLLLLPAHLSHTSAEPDRLTEKLGRINQWAGNGMTRAAEIFYPKCLDFMIAHRYPAIASAVCLLLVSAGLVQGGWVGFDVFPDTDGVLVTATVRMPEGTSFSATRAAAEQVENGLLRMSEAHPMPGGASLVKNRLVMVGKTVGEDEDDEESGPHLAGILAVFHEPDERGISLKEIEQAWEAAAGPVFGAESVVIAGMAQGPPGDPIEIWIRGQKMDDLQAAAAQLAERLKRFDTVSQVRTDISPAKREIRLRLKPEARALGLTAGDLAGQIQAGYYGREILRVQRGRDDIRVKVRYTAEERRTPDLGHIRIRTGNGAAVPLYSVADVVFAPGFTRIDRVDGLRRIRVSADIRGDDSEAGDIIDTLEADALPGLRERFPGLIIDFEGEEKHMNDSLGSLIVGFPLAVFAIYMVIAALFQSYIQPFLILLIIPFGCIGALFGHLAMGYDLSLMSLFGIVALTGIVVNDAIVLIERINVNLAGGMPYVEAVRQGGIRRFRAIVLTTLSTVGGLFPLILETGLQARFLIPMAVSVAFGVAFATVLTLGLLPVMMVVMDDIQTGWRRFFCRG